MQKFFYLWIFLCNIVFTHTLCENKKFNLSISREVSFKEVLEALAKECMLNIIYKDKTAPLILKEKNIILNFYQEKLANILEVGFESLDLDYEFHHHTIKISSLKTQTFLLHYLATSRIASSNTNIIFSQDREQGDLNSLPTHQNSLQSPLNSNFLQEDTKQLSGSKISSIDMVDFWGELENELKQIVFRENDRYIPIKGYQPITINKGSGFVTITATPSQVKRAKQYLEALNEKISLQVLIDVQILSISHKNILTTGIDWSSFYQLGIQKQNLPLFASKELGINIFSQDLSIGKIIEFLHQYGSVQTISNPKILTLNNQPALISVGNILRYTQNYIYQTSNTTTTLQNTRQQYPSIFSGVLLDITPSIQKDTILLRINPSITATKDTRVENEADALSSPPNLSTHQISSIVRLKDNQKVILGGLISKTHSKENKKLPILGYIPLIKYFFSYSKHLDQVQEMVIIITPKIIRFNKNY